MTCVVATCRRRNSLRESAAKINLCLDVSVANKALSREAMHGFVRSCRPDKKYVCACLRESAANKISPMRYAL